MFRGLGFGMFRDLGFGMFRYLGFGMFRVLGFGMFRDLGFGMFWVSCKDFYPKPRGTTPSPNLAMRDHFFKKLLLMGID